MRSTEELAARQVARFGIAGLLIMWACGFPDEVSAPAGEQPAIELAVAPSLGMVGEWKLDETGDTTAFDTQGDNDANVAGGASFVPGKPGLGNGLDLNNGISGTGGKYAEIPNDGSTLQNVQEGNYTISSWFYPHSIPQNTVFEDRNWAIVVKSGQTMGLVYQNDQRFAARHYLVGDTLEIATSTGSHPINAWYHVAGVVSKSQGTVKLFVNGTLQSTGTFTANRAAREYGTTPFRLGKGLNFWAANGKVDQVRIYNRALTDSEIDSLYLETAPPTGGPTVTTNPATAVKPLSATLNGSVDPNGSTTTAYFRYDTLSPGSTCTNTFGTRAPATGGTSLSGSTAQAYSRQVTGLDWGTTYYYCAVASNAAGIGMGTVRSFTTPFRFPVGMTKGNQYGLIGQNPTPDGLEIATRNPTDVRRALDRAQSVGARIALRVTPDNGRLGMPGDSFAFDPGKWESEFRLAVGNVDPRPYLRNGTLVGLYAIDEPFPDFPENMSGDLLERICRFAKETPNWGSVPCLIRDLNTRLYQHRPASGTYRYVDAGWTQLADHQWRGGVAAYPYSGIRAYMDSNLVQGRRANLALVYGFNLINGGTGDAVCLRVGHSRPDRCAMTDDEVTELTTILEELGDNQGCGVNGWQIDQEQGSAEWNYFYGLGIYAGNGIQSALQNMQTRLSRIRPLQVCSLHNLPAP